MKVPYRVWPKAAAVYAVVYGGVLIAAAAHWGFS